MKVKRCTQDSRIQTWHLNTRTLICVIHADLQRWQLDGGTDSLVLCFSSFSSTQLLCLVCLVLRLQNTTR